MEILQGLLDNLTALLAAHPLAGEWYMAFVRFLFPALYHSRFCFPQNYFPALYPPHEHSLHNSRSWQIPKRAYRIKPLIK